MDIKNSTILITGGTNGIGLEMVKQLLPLGPSDIIVTGRDARKLMKVKSQFPLIHTFQSDVSKPEDIRELYTLVTQQFPNLNIIINNAGIMRNLDLRDQGLNLTDITSEIDINLSGTIQMVHQFLPYLLNRPSAAVVNVSSGLAFLPFPLSPVYSAAKAGIHAYTQILRLQLRDTNIKIIELAPPATDTSLGDPFEGLVDSSINMKTDKMVSVAIKGIMKDTSEIKPGLSKLLKIMSRIAPDTALKMVDSTIRKATEKLKNER
ncbi:SDR family oxidoreductase [Dyadobacter sp. CY326]|uniref:SDR family oxidoreductase n=1 Tax=Dyadobacter sp. CY326 TaxID=2907300 RepID=UPI001F3CFEB3|nr:SDR family NAD(P)-dependent oxidoreductase [Dyadobacter sp. CY326]MCE7067192.1 SDR family NAD(P)-dependent oxidoreductase [Dyadobacter sp. CY326]